MNLEWDSMQSSSDIYLFVHCNNNNIKVRSVHLYYNKPTNEVHRKGITNYLNDVDIHLCNADNLVIDR